MYCPTCNLPGKGRFCKKDGSPLVEGDPPSASAAAAATPGVPPPAADSPPAVAPGAQPVAEQAPSKPVNPSFLNMGMCECGAGPDRIGTDGLCGACQRKRIQDCSVCSAPASEINPNGVCGGCGNQRLPKPGDHDEKVIGPECAAAADLGKRHVVQQDRTAIDKFQIPGATVYVLNVNDGVSSSSASGPAAEAAATAAIERVRYCMTRGMSARDALGEATRAAQKAVCGIQWAPQPTVDGSEDESPTCTFVMSIIVKKTGADDAQVTTGWVGDSRSYGCTAGATKADCLVKDDSWLNWEVAQGHSLVEIMKEGKVEHMLRAIVRSLGSNESTDATKMFCTVSDYVVPKGGYVVVCSDGLHVYLDPQLDLTQLASESGQLMLNAQVQLGSDTLAALIRPRLGSSALTIAKFLCDFANSKGGKDNVSAAVFCN